jgi:hypothetical protein
MPALNYPLKPDTLVRYAGGSTALAMIYETHSLGYYAIQCMGSVIFITHESCIEPSLEDYKTWIEHERERKWWNEDY